MNLSDIIKKHEVRILVGERYSRPESYTGVRSYDAICEHLKAYRRADMKAKAIVFSHLDALTDVWVDVETGERHLGW